MTTMEGFLLLGIILLILQYIYLIIEWEYFRDSATFICTVIPFGFIALFFITVYRKNKKIIRLNKLK